MNLRYADWMPEVAASLYRMGFDDAAVASALGVSRRSIITWAHDHPEFTEARRESKAVADARVANALYSKALSGDLGSCVFWLCNRDPANWKNTQKVEHSGGIEVANARQKLEDEVAAVIAEAERATEG